VSRKSLDRDFWAAAVLLGGGLFFIAYIYSRESGAAVFGVSPRTMPFAMAAMITGLALALMIMSVVRGAPPDQAQQVEAEGDTQTRLRVGALFVSSVAYIAAMGWVGYFAASALFVACTALLFGNRRWVVILVMMLLAPLALRLFFEKFMVIPLPEWRLGG
jgi:Tripartite tricarboxylate transporter TctB family